MRTTNIPRRSPLLIAGAAVVSFGLGAGLFSAGPAGSAGVAVTAEDPRGPGAASSANSPAERSKLLRQARGDAPAQAERIGLGSREELVVRDVVADDDGTTHIRYDRIFAGLPVIGGDLIVHENPDGHVYSVTGAHHDIAVASTSPGLGPDTARAAARTRLALRDERSTAGLAVYARRDQKARLVWDTVVTGVKPDQTPSRTHVVVDAHSGKLVAERDEVHSSDEGTGHSIYSGEVRIGTTPTGTGYEMRDGSRGGAYTVDARAGGAVFTDADDVWGDATQGDPASAGVDVHWGTAMTWDYYLDRHGRSGIFADGRGLRSDVHVGDGLENAFWDGAQAHYGDGRDNARPFVALDIVAHELGHGLVQATSGFLASSMNEAAADILGAAVEFYADSSEDVPDYLIGEELDQTGSGSPLRYMDRPSRGGSPDCWSMEVEGMQTHAAAGPADHWYYLASEGSGANVINGVSYDSPTCDGSTLSGIGHEKVEDVFYRALTVYLTSGADYVATRDATVQAAIDIFGHESTECATIEAAWEAVTVPSGLVTCAERSAVRAPKPRESEGSDLRSTACGAVDRSAAGRCTTVTGTLQADQRVFLRQPNGWLHSSARTLEARLDGPQGADFDLYLQKYNGERWVTVRQSLSPTAREAITYPASTGYYSWVVHAYPGSSGAFTFSFN